MFLFWVKVLSLSSFCGLLFLSCCVFRLDMQWVEILSAYLIFICIHYVPVIIRYRYMIVRKLKKDLVKAQLRINKSKDAVSGFRNDFAPL